jgi:NAD(P)H-flavin reductase
MQWHPFMISWWYPDQGNMNIVLIVEQKRGFTASLGNIGANEIRAFIDGPYGRELHLDSYSTVLLFASGVGIAGQLPCVKQLLEDYHIRKANCRRIALFWEMDVQGII